MRKSNIHRKARSRLPRVKLISNPQAEPLESRQLLSVAYSYTLISQSGRAGITAIGSDVSINDSNVIAFQGNTSSVNGIFAGKLSPTFPVSEITGGSGTSGVTFAQFGQINNSNIVVANERFPGPTSAIQTYNAQTFAFTNIQSADSGTPYSAVFFPVINNSGRIVYAALKNSDTSTIEYLEDNLGNEAILPGPGVIQLRMAEADNGVVILRAGNSSTAPIVEYLAGLGSQRTVATNGTYSALGQSPGISDDGGVAAFYGVDSAGPGIFVFANGSVLRVAGIQRDPLGNVIGPISAFSADTRVAVNLTPSAHNPGFVVFQATGTDGKAGLYSVELDFDSTSTNPGNIVPSAPNLVMEAGKTVPGLLGNITSISTYDPVNLTGNIAFSVTTDTGGTGVIRATRALRPVLILPGIGGSFMSDTSSAGFLTWLMGRGADPTTIKLDPYTKAYDDILQTLENQGYVLNQNLFAAAYDWRVEPGPNVALGTATGHVSGLTGANITNGVYSYGVDYLGYWLKQAQAAWEAKYGEPLDKVDIISHSTGGLVARTYIQSDAYGDTYSDATYGTLSLPKVADFVMAGVPNRGAAKALNPFVDNWSIDPSFAGFLAKIVNAAYLKVVDYGMTVTGPAGTDITLASILVGGVPIPKKFIHLYSPTIRDLIGTYPLVNIGTSTLQTVASVPALSGIANTQVDNLNGGSDPNAFADLVDSTTVVYGTGQTTPFSILQHTGPGPAGSRYGYGDYFNEVFSMNDDILHLAPYGHNPGTSEVWYEDQLLPNGGDGTVPLISSEKEFEGDSRFTLMGFNATHLGLMADNASETYMLQQLGVPIVGAISTSLAVIPSGGALSSSVFAMSVDPVDAVLVDSSGRRLGFVPGTGIVNEIPNSVYIGGDTGLGFIFGNTSDSFTLQLTGTGGRYTVKVLDLQPTISGGAVDSGTLAVGETKNIAISTAGAAPFASIVNGVLTVSGTTGGDTINLTSDGSSVTAVLNNQSSTAFANGSFSAISVLGDAGNDTISIGTNVPAVSVSGGPGGDTISGGSGNDTLAGGKGQDSLFGGPGDDELIGALGNDTLAGGQGNDQVFAGQGNDLLKGAKGDDTLTLGLGLDIAFGGQGNDLFFALNNDADTLYGGLGNDIIHYDANIDQIPSSDIETLLNS